MKVLVLGDIHGNLIALEKVLDNYKNEIDSIVCHGDVVNYGPWSNECVELLETTKAIKLLGNHEEYFLNGSYPKETGLVKDFFDQTYNGFKHLDVLEKYGKNIILDGFEIVHTVNNQYFYPDSDISKLELKYHTIIGHSHYPFQRTLENGNQFINTGSVGQNRKDLSIINFVIVDLSKNIVEPKSLSYNPMPLIEEMKVRKYKNNCIEYYLSKLKSI